MSRKVTIISIGNKNRPLTHTDEKYKIMVPVMWQREQRIERLMFIPPFTPISSLPAYTSHVTYIIGTVKYYISEFFSILLQLNNNNE